MNSMNTIYTIGHSDHPIERFIALLLAQQIDVLVDVRSAPWSRRFPQYAKDALVGALKDVGVRYVWMGERLGGRPSPRLRAQMQGEGYAGMAETPFFREGIASVLRGRSSHRLALMCAERDPVDCHRALLVGRALATAGGEVAHLDGDCGVQTQQDFEGCLLERAGAATSGDLFASREELLDLAYRAQERRATGESGEPQ